MNEESIVLVGDLGERALTLPEKAKMIKVTDEASLAAANQFTRLCKDIMDEVDALFNPHIKGMLERKRALEKDRAKYWDPPNAARGAVRTEISHYAAEQAENQKKAELELQAAAKRALVASAAGEPRIAEKFIAQAAAVHQPLKAAGLSFRDDWKFEIVNAALSPPNILCPMRRRSGRQCESKRKLVISPASKRGWSRRRYRDNKLSGLLGQRIDEPDSPITSRARPLEYKEHHDQRNRPPRS